MSHFEIEVKSLLGEKEKAEALKDRMQELDPNTKLVSQNSQLNHYFKDGDVQKLFTKVEHLFTGVEHEKLQKVIERGMSFSVRTRQKDEEVLLVVKAAIDDGTSENTVKRIEFEEAVGISLKELDSLVLEAGFSYQAKWSREREEYTYKDVGVCIDRNAGYGYLAEVEKLVSDESQVDAVHDEINAVMGELGLSELQQDRLGRMFDFYNENWAEYYGTNKTFSIE